MIQIEPGILMNSGLNKDKNMNQKGTGTARIAQRRL